MNSELKEGVIYKARIVDQVVTEPAGEDGLVMTLVLTVRILAQLQNDSDPSGPTLECDEQERDVLIRIVGDDEDSLRMAIKDLERLGFADDDVSRLHPDHPNAHRLIDKNVHVRCKAGRNGGMFWNLAWPRSKAALAAIQQKTSAIKQKVAAARGKAGKQPTRENGKADCAASDAANTSNPS